MCIFLCFFPPFKLWIICCVFSASSRLNRRKKEVVLLVTASHCWLILLHQAQSDSRTKRVIDHCNLLILWRVSRSTAFFSFSFFVALHSHFCAYRGRFSPSISGRRAAGTLEPFCVSSTPSSCLNKFQLNPFFSHQCVSNSHLHTLSCDTWDNICLQHLRNSEVKVVRERRNTFCPSAEAPRCS